MDQTIAETTVRKLTFRLVTFTWLMFFIAWLDRANVGFAALSMNEDLKFSNAVYGLGAGLFFLGYAIFQVPSNLVLHRVGPRRWLATIMVVWGVLSAGFAFVRTPEAFYALRLGLGAAEAGFVPGVLIYLVRWFPLQYRARALGNFFTSAIVALIVMGPLSTQLMHLTDGLGGWRGWQWMFVLEAIPAVAVGIVCLWILTERLEDAYWLGADQKAWLAAALASGEKVETGVEYPTLLRLCADSRIWALTAIYGLWGVLNYGFLMWLPQILKSWGSLSTTQVGWLSTLPFISALLGVIILPRSSDHTGERKLHLIIPALTSGVALAISAVVPPVGAFLLICVAGFGIFGLQPIFWTLPTTLYKGRSAAAGVAIVNSAAAVGGFLGPFAVGWIRDATGSFSPALFALGGSAFALAAAIAAMRISRTAGGAAPIAAKASTQTS